MKNIIIIFILAGLCVGCRVKKIDKTEENTTEKDSAFSKQKEQINDEFLQQADVTNKTVKAVEITAGNYEITPIDNSKPIEVINGKGEHTIITNGKLNIGTTHTTENSTSTTHDATKTSGKTTAAKSIENGAVNEKKGSKKAIHEDIKPSSLGYFWWLFFILLLALILYLSNKYSDKINFKNLLGKVIAVFKK